MKLELGPLKHLEPDAWRTLEAVEQGHKNHEIVPTELIERLSNLRLGGAKKRLKDLLKLRLVRHDGRGYDGYRITSLGYDYLALRVLTKRGSVVSVGTQVGVGKEADVLEGMAEDGTAVAIKLHRLGRTSFRDVTRKREYGRKAHATWLQLSRKAAAKEHAFLKALYANGFSVPTPVDYNRHAVVMEFLQEAYPLTQVCELGHPEAVYEQALNQIRHLARCGLVHCDFNEFNLMISDDEHLVLIDLPQMVSTRHRNAPDLLRRDVQSLRAFFLRKFKIDPTDFAHLEPSLEHSNSASRLDEQLRASGFAEELQEDYSSYIPNYDGSSWRPTRLGGDDDEGDDDEGSESDGDETSASEGVEEGQREEEEEEEEINSSVTRASCDVHWGGVDAGDAQRSNPEPNDVQER